MTESPTPAPEDGPATPEETTSGPEPTVLHPVLVAVSTVVAAGLVTVTGHADADLLGAAVALAGLVLAWGWPGTWSLPSPRGTSVVLVVATAACVLAVWRSTEEPHLELLAVAAAGSVLVSFVHQLLRRDGRPRLVESVAGTVAGVAVITSGACLIALPRLPHGAWLLTVGMAAASVAALVELLGRARPLQVWTLPIGLALGAVAALLVGQRGDLDWPATLVLGVAAAGVSHAIRRVLAALPTLAGHRAQLVSGAASVLLCGVLVVVVQRAFPL